MAETSEVSSGATKTDEEKSEDKTVKINMRLVRRLINSWLELKGPPHFQNSVASTEAFARLSIALSQGRTGSIKPARGGASSSSSMSSSSEKEEKRQLQMISEIMPIERDNLKRIYEELMNKDESRLKKSLESGQFTIPLIEYHNGLSESESELSSSMMGELVRKIQEKRSDVPSLQERCQGVLIAVMCGDMLGAPFEGMSYDYIREKFANPFGICHVYPGSQMGAREQGYRCGMYTDDSMTTLALADCLTRNTDGIWDAKQAALCYAEWWKCNPFIRGLPDTAKVPLNRLWELKDDGLLESSKHDAMVARLGRANFEEGSFANGAAMRISGVGCAFRNASIKVLKSAVKDAVLTSHVHPQSLDAALCVCLAIRKCLNQSDSSSLMSFPLDEIIEECIEHVQTEEMRCRLLGVRLAMKKFEEEWNSSSLESDPILMKSGILELDLKILKQFPIANGEEEESSETDDLTRFQIKSIELTPLVFYCLARWADNPLQCVINTVTIGGDNDTTGSVIAGILGSMYGLSWLPESWLSLLENETCPDTGKNYGKDAALHFGTLLSKMDLTEHSSFVESVTHHSESAVCSIA